MGDEGLRKYLLVIGFTALAWLLFTFEVHGGVCQPAGGVPPAEDVAYGQCLFESRTAFGQDPMSLFPRCATCHYSGSAFQDRAVHFNILRSGKRRTVQVLRNTPTLFNVADTAPYGWDGRNATIQAQALDAIVNPLEMDGTGATPEQLDALAAFVKTIRAPESAYDQFVAGNVTALSAEAQKGLAIFLGKGTCAGCHVPPLFTNNTLQTNQVNATFTGKTDPGAGFVGTGPTGFFNVPQLRGLRFTTPYMHNGALGTIEEVVRFYNKSFSLELTNEELYWLGEFLRSL